MRRKDKEVKDMYGIGEVIRERNCCRLAFPHGKSVYTVPLSFEYNEEENAFYLHGAAEGRKMGPVRQIGYTGFEVDIAYDLKEADQACEYSPRYRSTVEEGPVWVVEEVEEKKEGSDCIMGHMLEKDG